MKLLISIVLISNMFVLPVYAQDQDSGSYIDESDTEIDYAVLPAPVINDTDLVGCETKVKDCDAAVNAALKVIDDQKTQIANYSNESALQKQIIQDQGSELNSFWHNPVDMGLTGVVLTIILLTVTGHVK